MPVFAARARGAREHAARRVACAVAVGVGVADVAGREEEAVRAAGVAEHAAAVRVEFAELVARGGRTLRAAAVVLVGVVLAVLAIVVRIVVAVSAVAVAPVNAHHVLARRVLVYQAPVVAALVEARLSAVAAAPVARGGRARCDHPAAIAARRAARERDDPAAVLLRVLAVLLLDATANWANSASPSKE